MWLDNEKVEALRGLVRNRNAFLWFNWTRFAEMLGGMVVTEEDDHVLISVALANGECSTYEIYRQPGSNVHAVLTEPNQILGPKKVVIMGDGRTMWSKN